MSLLGDTLTPQTHDEVEQAGSDSGKHKEDLSEDEMSHPEPHHIISRSLPESPTLSILDLLPRSWAHIAIHFYSPMSHLLH